MNTFTSFGCSYSYGAGLYYHEWLKDKPKGYQIPHRHDSWVRHHELISSSDHRFREDYRFLGLLSNELGMDFYDNSAPGGNNTNIIESSLRFVRNGAMDINNDEVIDRKIEFVLVQLTDPTRDYIEPTQIELREWDKYKSFEEHFDEHMNNLVRKIDILYEDCKKLNIKLYVFSMEGGVGIKLINKEYFIPILFDNKEYDSIDNLKMEKNGIPNSNGQLIWTMGKNINVPLLMCDELHQYGVRDTHLGLNGHKIVKDSIMTKIRGVRK